MSREKKKVYEYDQEGTYLRSHDSVTDFGKLYGLEKNISKRRIEYKGVFYEFEDGRVFCLTRIGRKGVKLYKKFRRSPFVGNYKAAYKAMTNGFKYEVYDLDGELMATFKSDWHLKLLTGVDVHSKFAKKNTPVTTSNGMVIHRITP